jgi:hypothetical protein
MERSCSHCDQPDSSLLRVVLIGEILRADEATLSALAKIFQAVGLIDPSDPEAGGTLPPVPAGQDCGRLRLVK